MAAPLMCRLGCGNLANPHWEQLCSRCFYFNALAPALALESIEVHAEQRGKARSLAAETKESIPRQAPSFHLCVLSLEICIFCFTLVVNGGPEALPGSIGPSAETLYKCGGLQLQAQKQVWRLFTAMFLHAGVIHLVSNLLLQFVVGGAVELVWGTAWAITLHMASGLGGALVSASFSSLGSMSVGASGCVHGFLAAACVERRAALLLPWALPSRRQVQCRGRWQVVVFILVVSLALGLFLPQIDSWAHLGGTVAGFAVAAVRPWPATRLVRLARVLALLCGLGGAALCIYLLSCGSCYQPPGQIAVLM